ncbi:MFS transporter [Apilactobacillus timberlakei]|uniref:MFS transporter n=1 Tax=Apilactobacillus timberlakei TaxID=2008380 RepID=UPI00112DC987|nr:MFS transporter [Apilactobacillus timberlakei]TPR23256.1 MFS transporter [Apilactobacillus timberlakei]
MDKKKFGIILPIILISYFLILLDNSVVFTSSVKIASDLNLSTTETSWITNIYALMFGGLLLIGGRAGDIFGRKKIFIIGLSVFTLGSLLVGSSVNGIMIIGMRAFQGIGSAIIAPTSLALLLDNYSGNQRNKAISYYGVTAGLGASLGLVIGGLIATFSSWRNGFYINVPIGIILIFMTIKFVPNLIFKNNQRLDVLGSIVSVIGLFVLVYSINGNEYRMLAFIIAVIFIILFLIIEHKINNPIMPLELFKDNQRLFAYIGRFFYIGVMFSFFFLVPQALQNVYGFTPLMAALGFLPETVPQFIFGMVQSKMAEYFKNSSLLILGTLITIIGILLAFIIGIKSGYWLGVALPMLLIGIGQGFSFGPFTTAGVANTNKNIAGAASSTVNVFHQLGSSVVLSIIIALSSNIENVVNSYIYEITIMCILIFIPFIAALIIKKYEK